MWFLVLACSSPPSPAEVLQADLESMERTVRTAARSEEQSCQAIAQVVELAPRIDAAVQAGEVSWDDLQSNAVGLTEVNGRIHPDWRELSLAVGPGKLGPALITVGGVLRPSQSCTDLAVLTRWMTRLPTLASAPECVQPILRTQIEADVVAAMDRCVCGEPDPDPTPVLASRLENAGMTIAEADVRESVGVRSVCPPTGTAEPTPAPQ